MPFELPLSVDCDWYVLGLQEDDETTIAADEALITEDEKKEELNMLQREGELPLEELLKLYRRDGGTTSVQKMWCP